MGFKLCGLKPNTLVRLESTVNCLSSSPPPLPDLPNPKFPTQRRLSLPPIRLSDIRPPVIVPLHHLSDLLCLESGRLLHLISFGLWVCSINDRAYKNLRERLFLTKSLRILKSLLADSMASRRHVRYSPLAGDETEDSSASEREKDLRFAYVPRSLDRIPWKSIVLALFLLSLGSLLLFLSFFIFTGHMGGDRSQAYGFLMLGFLAFLPGFYETRIAYYSWRGAKGYRFAAIPGY